MARIRLYDQNQVAPGAAPGARVDAPQSNVGEIAAQQQQAMGQQVERTAQAASAIQLDMLERANAVRVNEAMNAARRTALDLQYGDDGFEKRQGENALPDAFDGQTLTNHYARQYDEQVGEIARGLGNSAQREQFQASAGQLGMALRGQAQTHELTQFVKHEQSVLDGGIALAQDEAATAWQTPDRVRAAITQVGALTNEKLDRFGGLAANDRQAHVEAMQSDTIVAVIKKAAGGGDLSLAQRYAAEFKDQLTAAGATDVDAILKPELEAEQARSIVSLFRPGGPAPFVSGSTNVDAAFSVIPGTESGNRQTNAAGGTITSNRGAQGIAQVMPDTARDVARRLGRPELATLAAQPTAEGRAANLQLGRAYFGQQVEAFGGDVRKAYAAYNAGPRWVEGAVARAAAAQPGTEQADWFWQLNHDGRTPSNRRQTEDYVQTNWSKYQAQVGIATGGAGGMKLSEALAAADAQLPENASERTRQLVAQGVTRNFQVAEHEADQTSAAGLDAAYKALIANDGRMDQLPATVRSAIPAGQYDSVLTFARTISNPVTQTSGTLYYDLSNEDNLRSMTDTQFLSLRGQLSPSDFESFGRKRQDLLHPPRTAQNDPGTLPSADIARGLGVRLEGMGVPTTGRGVDRGHVGAIRQYVDGLVGDAQQRIGRRLTDVELNQLLDRTFAQNVTLQGFLGRETTAPLLGRRASDLASADWHEIADRLKARGVTSPTDSQIELEYYRSRTGRR